MTQSELLQILDIPEIIDEATIKNAYRKQLILVNPEDDAEGFKLLRTAYELALKLLSQPKSATILDLTPIDLWIQKISTVYTNFPNRINPSIWKEVLSEDICLSLDTCDDVRTALLTFLMDHFRLPASIWKLLNNTFNILSEKELLYNDFPASFIDFMVHEIQSTDEEWLKYHLFSGETTAPYDSFISHYIAIKDMNTKNSYKDIENLFSILDAMPIDHPYLDTEKMCYYLNQGDLEKVIPLERKLREGFSDDTYILYHLSQVTWHNKLYQQSYEDCQIILERSPNHYGANLTVCSFYLEKKEYLKAQVRLSELLDIYGENEELLQKLDEANQKLIIEYTTTLIANPDDDSIKIELAWCFLQTNQLQQAFKVATTITYRESLAYDYYNLLGRVHFYLKDYKTAESYLLKWVNEILKLRALEDAESKRKFKRLSFAYSLLADCIYLPTSEILEDADDSSSRFESSLKYIDLAISTEPNDSKKISLLLTKSSILLKQEHFKDCIYLCDQIISLEPAYFPAYINRQESYYNLYDAQNVIDDFYNAIEIYDGYAKPYILATKTFYNCNQYEDALDIIKKASDSNIQSLELEFLDLRVKLRLASEESDYQYISMKLEALFTKAQDTDHDLEDIYHILNEQALCAMNLYDHEKALDLINQKLTLKPSHNSYKLKGDILYHLHQFEEALTIYEKVLLSFPDSVYLMIDILDCLVHLEKLDSIIYYSNKVLELEPDHPSIHRQLMWFYSNRFLDTLDQKDYEKATYHGECQVEIEPSSHTYLKLGETYSNGYEFEKACHYFELAIDHGYEDLISVQVKLAKCYKELKNYSKAIVLYESLLAHENINNVHSDAYNYLAQIYMVINNPQKAIEYLQKAIHFDPNTEVSNLAKIAAIYFSLGNIQKAKEAHRQILKVSPITYEVYLNSGKFYEFVLGKNRKALAHYKKALKAISKDYNASQEKLILYSLVLLCHKLKRRSKVQKYAALFYQSILKSHGSIDTWINSDCKCKRNTSLLAEIHYCLGEIDIFNQYLSKCRMSHMCIPCYYYSQCIQYMFIEVYDYELKNDYQSAIKCCEDILKIAPNHAQTLSKLKNLKQKYYL